MHFETIQFLLSELCVRADGLLLDAILETVNNFKEIFEKNELIPSDKTIPEALFSDSEEAKVTIQMLSLLIFLCRNLKILLISTRNSVGFPDPFHNSTAIYISTL